MQTPTTVTNPSWPSMDANGIPLVDPVSLTYQGTLALFARERGVPVTRLFYNVLRPNATADSLSGGWIGWNQVALVEPGSNGQSPAPQSADQQPMLRIAGIDLITVPPLAATADPADAPLRVVTDGRYISCVRVSKRGSLYVDRFILVETAAPETDAQANPQDETTWLLNRAWEIRYRRSEKRDSPNGKTDTLDSSNMMELPFLEPTTEIWLPSAVLPGQFTVTLTPTSSPEKMRYQFFSISDNTINVTSYPQDSTGRVLISDSSSFSISPLIAMAGGATQPLQCDTGLAATVYEEQEQISTAPDEPLSVRRATRLMLSVPITQPSIGLTSGLAIFDFLVQPDGTLPAFPPNTGCLLIDGTISDNSFQPLVASSYPVPSEAVHVVGEATVCGVVLGQTQAGATPYLFDSGDGLVHCYFAGPAESDDKRPFLVAQYDPSVTRAVAELPWASSSQNGQLSFISSRSGTTFNQLIISVDDCANQPDLCDLSIDYGAPAGLPKELWKGVPRELFAMASVLNGLGSQNPSDPKVRSGGQNFYDYSGNLKQARLPLTPSDVSSVVAIISRRRDMPLESVVVDQPSGQETNLSMTFSASSGAVKQTWKHLPVATSRLMPILRGDVSPAVYSYEKDPDDTLFLGITTTGGTILLVAASATEKKLSVTTADDLLPNHCNVVVEQESDPRLSLSNLPRAQADLVNALRNNEDFAKMFPCISPDPVDGQAVNQQIDAPLDLRGESVLFDTISPHDPGSLIEANVNASIVQGHSFISPPSTPPSAAIVGPMIALTAAPLTSPSLGETGIVANGSSTLGTQGQNGAWIAAARPQAIQFNGKNAVGVPLSSAQALNLKPGRAWTIETWCYPTDGAESRILCYNAGPPSQLAGVVPSYFIGTKGMPSLQYKSYTPNGAYTSSYINVPAEPEFDLTSITAFTWEAWINPSSPPCPPGQNMLGCIVQGQDSFFPASPQFQLGLSPDCRLTFGYRSTESGTANEKYVSAPQPLNTNTWTHVAVTGSASSDGWTFNLYINAQLAQKVEKATLFSHVDSPFVCIGASDISNVSLFGNLAELRYWKAERSEAELHRTMNTSLSGYEPGLLGYWALVEKPEQGAVFKNGAFATGAAWDGKMQIIQQGVSSSTDGTFLSILHGIGGAPPQDARAFLRSNRWNHIAMTYEACGAIALNLNSSKGQPNYGIVQNAEGLEISDQASFEAWIQMPAAGLTSRTILSQWGTEPNDQAYQFAVGPDGFPYLSVTVLDPNTQKPVPLTGKGLVGVCDAKPHHLAATWSMKSKFDEQQRVFQITCTIVVYVDGIPNIFTKLFTSLTATVAVVASSASICLGISALSTPKTGPVPIETQAVYQGVITGVRIWSITLTAAQVSASMQQHQDYDQTGGIVASWWFDEQEGITAADSLGSSDITLNATGLWAAFSSIATIEIFGNGNPIGRVEQLSSALGYQGATQFTVASYINDGQFLAGFNGAVTELRIWKMVRERDQLLDTMYHQLNGDEAGLQAYWRFNGTAIDQTGHGNDGTLAGTPAPVYIESTAPVANEGPQVRNVYNGPQTVYQEYLMGTPAVIEFGDAETQADQTLVAVLRRGYFYNNPNLTMSTEYGVGQLDLIYLGQVQTHPTLIGYIEGAPPVPSENLSRPLYKSSSSVGAYNDATTVSLTQTETNAFTFTSQDYKTKITMDIDLKAGVFGIWNTSVGTPFFVENVFKSKLKVGVHNKDNLVIAHQTDQKYISSWTRTLTDTLGLRGAWEQGATPEDYVNPQVGRRFQPANLGYALVESLTADLFAMRMRSTGAMVGRIVVPNLAIPPDRNILTFQIDPHYIKNGTLDGKVGLVDDPTYSNADFERGSYFKPVEAYVMKAAIERQEQDLKVYFDQFDSVAQGEAGNADLSGPARKQFYDFEANVGRKGIVNTYVWSAYGGLHKEEEQISSTHERTYTGFYSVSWSIGPMVDLETAFKIGVFGGLDLLLGGQVRVQVGKTISEAHVFGIAATAPGDPTLATYDPATDTFSMKPCPGKVRSYRFMTFYLPPSQTNASKFRSVVDNSWLDFSSDADAVALRTAKIEGNSIWRVLHRVTYVNRVPPAFDTNPAQTVSRAEKMQAIILDDNMMLLKLFTEALGSNPPTPTNIGNALAFVLTGQNCLLGKIVPWWQTFVNSASGPTPNPAAAALLNQIVNDSFAYLTTGYATAVLPIESAAQESVKKASASAA